VYFCCAPQGPPEHAAYQHSIVCIAEGLAELGVEFAGTTDYWRVSADSHEHLIRSRSDLTPDDCSIVVVNETWTALGLPLPRWLFRRGRPYRTVYVDAADGIRTHSWSEPMRSFDVILRTHVNRRFVYPEGMRPWAFGLSRRMLDAINGAAPESPRDECLLFNFRVESPVRAAARKALRPLETVLSFDERVDPITEPPPAPLDRLMWEQSGRRHHPAYYERLAGTVACAAFGGWLLSPFPRDPSRPGALTRILRNLPVGPRRVLQFDSWRLWESLAAGCATFHLDLEQYGALLPVMPENKTHYLGLDLDDPSIVIDLVCEAPERLVEIGRAGREWALANYAPLPTARRFLDALDQ
jgi:hypothetical protein